MKIPTSLYIHIPWCIKKCPYCDFNSHKQSENLPEEIYVRALLEDFKQDLEFFSAREIQSIFIGGGTPSLFSPQSYEYLLNRLHHLVPFAKNIEITLEANPGTFEQERFKSYRHLGINRLSIGVQSFNPQHLKVLGRIHDELEAQRAIHMARAAGFDNINLDLMYGLPGQLVAEGLQDLITAIHYQPEHISWYELTIEPNTVFYKTPPQLPDEQTYEILEEEGFAVLEKSGYQRYEISAFSQTDKQAQHNLNYWLFGDYFGIGAGAHGKLTWEKKVYRSMKHRQPTSYLNAQNYTVEKKILSPADLLFEFMLNVSRLEQPIPFSLFLSRTGLSLDSLQPYLSRAKEKEFLKIDALGWVITPLGRRFTNELQALFLDDPCSISE